jgi:hypothetical protein
MMAATKPHAPAPMMATGMWGVSLGEWSWMMVGFMGADYSSFKFAIFYCCHHQLS